MFLDQCLASSFVYATLPEWWSGVCEFACVRACVSLPEWLSSVCVRVCPPTRVVEQCVRACMSFFQSG